MTTWYEWDVEQFDPATGDVIDHNHADKLVDLPWCLKSGERLVLVRNTEDGRLWAYVDPQSHMLPPCFSRPEADGKEYETDVKVPQRFHREIARVACGGR